jgi:molybdopterin synthase sulfur carrier subunit
MPTVHIPPQMRDLVGGKAVVRVKGKSMRQVVAALESQFPGMGARLQDGDRFVSGLTASIDGVITNRGMFAAVGEESEVHFHPALGGGG